MFVIDPPRPTVLPWGLWFSDPAERITLNRPISLVIRRAIFRSKDNQSSKSLTGSSFRFRCTRLSCREHPVQPDGQMVLQVVSGPTAATWAARRT